MREWWKEAIGYEIYLQSFYDTNKDGIGDLLGVIQKLDYLKDLGVTLLWITPFYDSLMEDNGYDIKDHKKIASCYGNMEDFKTLLEEAHKRGMRVIIDLIMNHTSTSHPWFKQALKGSKKKKDYYIIKKEKEDGTLPNNWGSFFYESVWSKFSEEEYYMHIFSKNMPDLNWANPKVREEMYEIARYWLEIGVDGFRLDALAHLAKEPLFINSDKEENENGIVEDYSKFSNLPPVISYLSEFKRKVLEKYDCMTIGEVGGNISAKQALHYVNYMSGPINMMFNFEANGVHNGYGEDYEEVVCDVVRLKRVFETWIHTYGEMAWYPIYLTNHDQTRVISQYGNIHKRKESAKMLCAMQMFMGGTPFIYYGDEIGMSNADYTSIEDYKDIKAMNYINSNQDKKEEEILKILKETSRVNARTPMQWDASENAGFTSSNPHLKVNENYKEVNVKAQIQDEDSILSFYRKAIALRQNTYLDTVLEGTLTFIDREHKDVFAYKKCGKEKLMVIANFKDKEVVFTHKEEINKVVLQNYTNVMMQFDKVFLRPYEVLVAEIK